MARCGAYTANDVPMLGAHLRRLGQMPLYCGIDALGKFQVKEQ